MDEGRLADKNVGYWGDIDSEGLTILSDARSKLSGITPLMMDELTVRASRSVWRHNLTRYLKAPLP